MGVTFGCRAEQIVNIEPVITSLVERINLMAANFDSLTRTVQGLDLQVLTTLAKAVDILVAKDKEIEDLRNKLAEALKSKDDPSVQVTIDQLNRSLITVRDAIVNFGEHL